MLANALSVQLFLSSSNHLTALEKGESITQISLLFKLSSLNIHHHASMNMFILLNFVLLVLAL